MQDFLQDSTCFMDHLVVSQCGKIVGIGGKEIHVHADLDMEYFAEEYDPRMQTGMKLIRLLKSFKVLGLVHVVFWTIPTTSKGVKLPDGSELSTFLVSLGSA